MRRSPNITNLQYVLGGIAILVVIGLLLANSSPQPPSQSALPQGSRPSQQSQSQPTSSCPTGVVQTDRTAMELKTWGDIKPIGLEPTRPGYLTGPRAKPLGDLPALMVIIAGESGKKYVDEMITQFGVDKHRFMLFHYDESDWSKYPWYNKVISIRFPGQMKWWYVKRFVVPEVVAPYEYIGFWDEDVDVDEFDLEGYLDIMRDYNISMSQPGLRAESSKLYWPVTRQNKTNPIGRWSEFVECGPVTFFSREMYGQCIYTFLREDLTSGWGLDLHWHKFCEKEYGFTRSAVIDKYNVLHDGTLATTLTQPVKFEAGLEYHYYNSKFPPSARVNPGEGVTAITPADRVRK